MKAVWKFPLNPVTTQEVMMPVGAQVLTAAMQGHWITLWAEVDTEASLAPRVVEVRGTGHDSARNPNATQFVGTVFTGTFVWHVWVEAA